MPMRDWTKRRVGAAAAAVVAAVCGCGAASTHGAEIARARSAPPVRPGAAFVLVDRGLNTERVTLLRLSVGGKGGGVAGGASDEVVYLNSAGVRKTRPLSEVVALAPTEWAASPGGERAPIRTDEPPRPWLELVDGQRFSGAFVDSGTSAGGSKKNAEEPVIWANPRLGALSVPLDLASRYVGDAHAVPHAVRRPISTVSDTVILANGDRVEGFIERLGATIVIAPAGGSSAKADGDGGGVSEIAANQVVLANLVNERRELKGAAAWLEDGSLIGVQRADTDSENGVLTLTTHGFGKAAKPGAGTTGGATASMPLADLRALVVDAARLTPLSSLPIAAQRGELDRAAFDPVRVDPDPLRNAPLGAAEILLPGPMLAEWTLPEGTDGERLMLSGAAQMDESCWAWGDCVVVFALVSDGSPEREIARGRLNAETSSLMVRADLSDAKPGDRLRVRIEAGPRGPIQDRVTLRRFIFVSSGPGT